MTTHVVILTGAGVSAESGLRTFRDNDGLWENHRVEEVATPEAFQRAPEFVLRFYNERRQSLNEVSPNAAHKAIAEFEKSHNSTGGKVTLITQNIDDLHDRAGSTNTIPMHGELLKARCTDCGSVVDWREDILLSSNCPHCNAKSTMRPHVVWFGEMPLFMDKIEEALSQCDVFVAIGTSGNVYPAAGFVQMAKSLGAHTVELNLEPAVNGSVFDEQHYGPATEVVGEFLRSL